MAESLAPVSDVAESLDEKEGDEKEGEGKVEFPPVTPAFEEWSPGSRAITQDSVQTREKMCVCVCLCKCVCVCVCKWSFSVSRINGVNSQDLLLCCSLSWTERCLCQLLL